MLRLKQLLCDCGISRDVFCRQINRGYSSLNLCVVHEIFPKKKESFIKRVEAAVAANRQMMSWLKAKGLKINNIWDSYQGIKGQNPKDQARRISAGLMAQIEQPALSPGDPLETITHKEAELITPKAMRYFKLFRSPFVNDISDVRDIFMSEDHMFLKEMMLDTARYAGFTAVYGEVGSGKSIMRKAVVQELISDGIKVIYPIIIDKARITPASLIDAIVMDLSEEKMKRSLEAKTRQALRLLRNRATSGLKQVLIIEEAHLLAERAMKSLKQIYELEDGFSRLTGIILIGQPELKYLLDETKSQGMREVIRRITCAEITGMGADTGRYLAHKFGRINRKPEDIFAPNAFAAIERRLSDKIGRRNVSKAYPLTVNNLCARAMNVAAEMGEEKVTEDLVMSV